MPGPKPKKSKGEIFEMFALYSTGILLMDDLAVIYKANAATIKKYEYKYAHEFPVNVQEKLKDLNRRRGFPRDAWWHKWWAEKLKNPRIARFYEDEKK